MKIIGHILNNFINSKAFFITKAPAAAALNAPELNENNKLKSYDDIPGILWCIFEWFNRIKF